MGGLGHHPSHPYAIQGIAFMLSLLIPGSAFALLFGAWLEGRRRKYPRRTEASHAAIGARYLTETAGP